MVIIIWFILTDSTFSNWELSNKYLDFLLPFKKKIKALVTLDQILCILIILGGPLDGQALFYLSCPSSHIYLHLLPGPWGNQFAASLIAHLQSSFMKIKPLFSEEVLGDPVYCFQGWRGQRNNIWWLVGSVPDICALCLTCPVLVTLTVAVRYCVYYPPHIHNKRCVWQMVKQPWWAEHTAPGMPLQRDRAGMWCWLFSTPNLLVILCQRREN